MSFKVNRLTYQQLKVLVLSVATKPEYERIGICEVFGTVTISFHFEGKVKATLFDLAMMLGEHEAAANLFTAFQTHFTISNWWISTDTLLFEVPFEDTSFEMIVRHLVSQHESNLPKSPLFNLAKQVLEKKKTWSDQESLFLREAVMGNLTDNTKSSSILHEIAKRPTLSTENLKRIFSQQLFRDFDKKEDSNNTLALQHAIQKAFLFKDNNGDTAIHIACSSLNMSFIRSFQPITNTLEISFFFAKNNNGKMPLNLLADRLMMFNCIDYDDLSIVTHPDYIEVERILLTSIRQ